MASPTFATTYEIAHLKHYTLKQQITAASSRWFDRAIYTQRHGLIAGMRRKGGLGWLPVKEKESAELLFWRALPLAGRTVYDIGAFQGLLTLYFARTAGRVVAWEPSGQTRERLNTNISLNNLRNVIVRPVGIADTECAADLVAECLMTGGASLDASIQSGMRGRLRVERIQVTTLDRDVAECALPKPDVIKLDIEGLEAAALRGAIQTITQHRPAIFIEMHGDTMESKRTNAAEVVRLLEDYGYSHILHVESGNIVTSATSDIAMQGHLYTAFNHFSCGQPFYLRSGTTPAAGRAIPLPFAEVCASAGKQAR